ncbi:hypothetical protein CMO93_00925 [Candidatus Woesearchaeota archaeon]|nr:hypothetical protein [Candidatus Woesearchaeota archaeon]|tara:strand:- start:163 stop:1293 length:1131 start_codon:yes stop_codon:yes gene_type:complete
MQKQKIAILTPTFNHYSGMDRVAQLQAEDYVKKGNKVTVIALEAKIKPKRYKVIEIGMPKNLFLQRLYRLFFFLDRKKIEKYKLLKNYDLVISHFYPMNWLAYKAKKKYKIDYIYHDHGINTTGFLNNNFQKLYMKLFLFFNNITLKNIDKAFSVSKYLSKQLYKESGIKSKVVYNKIDKKRFNKNVKDNKVAKRYNLKNNKTLLYVGRIAPHKGIHLLLKSFNIVKKQVPNAKLLIVGKPTFNGYFKTLRNSIGISGAQKMLKNFKEFLAHRNGKAISLVSKKFSWELKRITNKDVIFTGFVPDNELSNYYAACNLYVTASQWEGFNLPAAEAQACGKKVVAFNIGSHPEVIKNGILVKNKDIKAFSEAVIKLVK